MRPGGWRSAVATLVVCSVLVVLVALTGSVAADGGAVTGSTAASAGDQVNVTGRIVDGESGQGIDRGRIVLWNRSTGTEFVAATNDTGAFEVAVDPDLTYRARYSQFSDGFPIDGVVDKHPLDTVAVGSSDVDLGTHELPEAHRLNVTVVDESGAPVADARVDVEGTPDDPGPDVGNRTDDGGRFVLGGTPGTETNGSVTVYVEPPEGAMLDGNRTRLTVTADRDLRVRLDPEVEVRGRIENADGAPVTAGRVVLSNRSSETGGGDRLGADGEFVAGVAPNLTYRARFDQRRAGYPLDGVVDAHPLGTVAVGGSHLDVGTRTLPEAHRLNVTVVDESGDPVEGARVAVEQSIDGVPVGVGNRTDARGRFLLGGTPGAETNGTVEVFVRPPDGTNLGQARTTVTVGEDRGVRVILERRVEVTGRVENADGAAVSTGGVVLANESTETFEGMPVRDDGSFALDVRPNRTYQARYGQFRGGFPIDGVVDFRPLGTVAVGSTGVDLGTVTLPEAGRLNVTVVDESGDPVEGARVAVEQSVEGARLGVSNRTDARGRFVLGGTVGTETSGTVELFVRPPDGTNLGENRTTLDVAGDREVRIVLEERAGITGRIEAPDGSPATGLTVTARTVSPPFVGDGDRTTATGAFALAVEPNRSYGVDFRQRNRTAEFPIDGVPDFGSIGTVDVGPEGVDVGTVRLNASNRLNVTVVDESGAPVADARVVLEARGGGSVRSRTDARGRFVLGGTPGAEISGSVKVFVETPEAPGLGDNLTVVNVTEARDIRLTVAPVARVTGRLETTSGAAVSTGGISFENDSADVRTGGAPNATGAFAIDVEPNRTYAVAFDQFGDGYPLDGVVDAYPIGTVAVGSTGVDLGTVTLPEAGRLNVTVVDESGDPVGNADVTVAATAGDVSGVVSGETDAAGRFIPGSTVGTEVNGTVDVRVRPPRGSDLGTNRTTVTVTGDRDLRVVLPRVVTVSGRILDPAGAPRADEAVAAFDVATGEFDAFERTNATGAFALAVPANDTYAVTFGDRGDDGFFPRNGVPDIYELDDVTPDDDVDLGEITVPGGHVLDVRVVDGNGTGVENATVEVRSTRGEDPRGAGALLSTGADGLARPDGPSVTGIEMTGPVAVEVNTTTAGGSFANATVTRTLTVTENTTVTVTVERTPTLVVDPDDPTAYDTIEAAVADAPAGGTVRVEPGIYRERVRIDEALTLTGAPGGDAPGPAPDAPVLDGGDERRVGIVLADEASGVTIEGFEIRNYTRGGIETSSRVRDVAVRHNAIHDIDGANFSAGVSTFQLDAIHRSVAIERNRFEAIGGDAVLLLNVHGAVVRHNAIVGTDDVGTRLFGQGSAGGVVVAPWANRTDVTTRDVRIENNTITGTIVGAGIGIVPRNLSAGSRARVEAVRIRNNTVIGPNVSRGAAVDPLSADASVADVSLDGNAFRSVERGLVVDAAPGRIRTIRVTRGVFTNSTSDAVRIVSGSAGELVVHNSSIAGSGGAGLNNSAAGRVDATYNWWGAPDGPGGAFDGSGDAVRGNATVRPFYVDAARTRLSSARLPPVVGDRRPRDPDGDGVYEDVNGDGDVTPGDATVLFGAVFDRNPAVMDHVDRFDFNADGGVTPGDATVLFNEAF